MTGIVLAGHGSHISPNTAGLVWRQVDALRALGIADEVTAAFWKEAPSFHRAVHALASRDIIIVPLFTADGYFTRTVIPAEMGLTGAVTARDGRTLHYTPSLSGHPYLTRMVQQRARDAMREHGFAPENTAIAVIGHSTRRNPDSRKATEQQAELLREAGLAAQVQAVYLDDSPEIPDIYTLTDAPCIVAVPYFLAAGSHTTIDVPEALGLPDGATRARIHGREVAYTQPVGVDADLIEVIVALVQSAGVPLHTPSDGDAWRGFPRASLPAFERAFAAGQAFTFGELIVSDRRVQVAGDASAGQAIQSPAELRALVREQPFRSLATGRGLPDGWYVPVTEAAGAFAVIETVYPGALADWAQASAGTLDITPLSTTAARQTGMYRALENLPQARLSAAVDAVCSGCVCCPLWAGRDPSPGDLPCAEACNHLLSAALEENA